MARSYVRQNVVNRFELQPPQLEVVKVSHQVGIPGIVRNGVVVPQSSQPLPDGSHVEIRMEPGDDGYAGSLPTVLVIPLSSAIAALPDKKSGLRTDSVALVFQLRAIDRGRITEKIGVVSESEIVDIRSEPARAVDSINPTPPPRAWLQSFVRCYSVPRTIRLMIVPSIAALPKP